MAERQRGEAACDNIAMVKCIRTNGVVRYTCSKCARARRESEAAKESKGKGKNKDKGEGKRKKKAKK